MTKRKYKFLVVKCALVLAIPFILWAYQSGPDAHHTGIPGTGEENCSTTCHIGTLNSSNGKVDISFPDGATYVPGQSQTFTITITDNAARRWGFQLTARLASDVTKMAGTFTPVVTPQVPDQQIVLCASVAINDVGGLRPSTGCPANRPLEFVEHGQPYLTNTFTVNWTPPATNAGEVNIYIAANAANGDISSDGDHIYTANFTLQPAGSGGAKPSILSGGVINAGAFGAQAGVAAGTWIEIYGNNISNTNRDWAAGDFNGINAPTKVDNVQVSINGKSAYISHVGTGQVNAQVPDGIATSGSVEVVITNGGQASDPMTVPAASIQPGLLAPPSFTTGGKLYVVAFATDLKTFVGLPSGFLGGRPAKPGEVIILYGIGFGPTTPAVAAGTITGVPAKLTAQPTILFDQTAVDPNAPNTFFGLASSAVGLYQFNLTVPNVGDGDHAFKMTVGGVTLPQTMFINTKQ